ncbi:MAG TPA: hypothetical protein VHR66_25985, partial [Gemmataceae bacterium]|nr:hypothetical protein [Gemmataceae bacterium]
NAFSPSWPVAACKIVKRSTSSPNASTTLAIANNNRHCYPHKAVNGYDYSSGWKWVTCYEYRVKFQYGADPIEYRSESAAVDGERGTRSGCLVLISLLLSMLSLFGSPLIVPT